MFLDFICYSGGPLPEEQLEKCTVPVSMLWGEKVWILFHSFQCMRYVKLEILLSWIWQDPIVPVLLMLANRLASFH